MQFGKRFGGVRLPRAAFSLLNLMISSKTYESAMNPDKPASSVIVGIPGQGEWVSGVKPNTVPG